MKLSFTLFLLAFFQLATAAPHLVRRQSADEAANIGFATLNGGTTGGAGGSVTTVTTLNELTSAVQGDGAKIVIVSGPFLNELATRSLGSAQTLQFLAQRVQVCLRHHNNFVAQGVGLRVINVSNVIIRNLAIQKVLAGAGDAIRIQASSQVWVDHVDLSSDLDHDKDFYDGLLDITHGSTGVTVSNSFLHDHFKSSLVGHSDSNGDDDTAITVTYANNYWLNLNSRAPSFRFGTGHIFNNVYEDVNDGINTRVGAQLLVENNVFTGAKKPLFSTSEGFAVANNNDFGGGENTAPQGTFTDPPYDYTLIDTANVRSSVVGEVGATLDFSA